MNWATLELGIACLTFVLTVLIGVILYHKTEIPGAKPTITIIYLKEAK